MSVCHKFFATFGVKDHKKATNRKLSQKYACASKRFYVYNMKRLYVYSMHIIQKIPFGEKK